MSIAGRVEEYLSQQNIDYKLIPHNHTDNSRDTARSANIAASHLAKAVILQDDDGVYLMAIIPANNKVRLFNVNLELERHFHLASEKPLQELFPDCEWGAIPALGQAYGMDILWDNKLQAGTDLYLEAGSHEDLIKIKLKDFIQLMGESPHADISEDSVFYSPYHSDEIRNYL